MTLTSSTAVTCPESPLIISFTHPHHRTTNLLLPSSKGLVVSSTSHYNVLKKSYQLSSSICQRKYSGIHNTWKVLAKSAHHMGDNDDKEDSTAFPAAVASDGSTTFTPSSTFLSAFCPLLKLFSGGDPLKERNYTLEVATSSLSSLARFPWGSKSLSNGQKYEDSTTLDGPNRLQLFEFEACPFCRRVREAMTELDLSVEVYPCPKGSVRHRETVRGYGGKELFPFLIDPKTGISMYESGEIVNYLFQQYGQGRSPSMGLLESTLFTGWVPTLLRGGRGLALWERARVDLPPEKMELFSYENNPYARIVREALCELELPYILHNVGKGSPHLNILLDKSGSLEVPYIVDPNTGFQSGDFRKILAYLFKTYAVNA